jgi:hypothetical protein
MIFLWSLAMVHSLAGRSLIFALPLLLIGCDSHRRSEALVNVSGQVTSDGKAFKVKPEERLTVNFCMLDAEGKTTEKSYLAQVDQKGHFTASVFPGKHRIVLRLDHGTRDNFHGVYGPTNSPFVQDVHEGDSLTLEIKTTNSELKKSDKEKKKRRDSLK